MRPKRVIREDDETETAPTHTVPGAKNEATAPVEALDNETAQSGDVKKKKEETRAKRKVENYNTYCFRVLKGIHAEIGITKKSMSIMNAFMEDMFEKIASEAAQLVKFQKKRTIGSKDIQTAVKLVVPGELAKHSVSEGTKALAKTQKN